MDITLTKQVFNRDLKGRVAYVSGHNMTAGKDIDGYYIIKEVSAYSIEIYNGTHTYTVDVTPVELGGVQIEILEKNT